MKLWEVLKALEENPEKKYKMVSIFGKIHEIGLDHNGYYTFSAIYNGKNIDAEPGGVFGGNIYREADWQEVKQSVTWQEAIEAWADGKKIMCECEGGKTFFRPSNVSSACFTAKLITNGTWYIED